MPASPSAFLQNQGSQGLQHRALHERTQPRPKHGQTARSVSSAYCAAHYILKAEDLSSHLIKAQCSIFKSSNKFSQEDYLKGVSQRSTICSYISFS